MCLIIFSYNVHKDYKLVLGANRDEFYDRPTAPADFWEDMPNILAGRDLQGGGTWMGINRKGAFAALTNFRVPFGTQKTDAPSRGALVSDFLKGNEDPKDYLQGISKNRHKYNGFNLIAGNRDELFYFSSKKSGVQKLGPGTYGLSNRFLDSPWPKVLKAKAGFDAMINKDKITDKAVFDILKDRSHPPDSKLPDTGVGIEWERILSPAFIQSPVYGTRSSTILSIDKKNNVRFAERTYIYNEQGFQNENNIIFRFWF